MKHSKKTMPKGINKEVPTAKDTAESITKVMTKNGSVAGYELSNGEHISTKEAIKMAKHGGICGVGIGVSGTGKEYLRSLPDGSSKNNLDNLPHQSME